MHLNYFINKSVLSLKWACAYKMENPSMHPSIHPSIHIKKKKKSSNFKIYIYMVTMCMEMLHKRF